MEGRMLKVIRIAYFALGLAVLVVEDLMDGVPGLQKKIGRAVV